jgi:hypothetical protein
MNSKENFPAKPLHVKTGPPDEGQSSRKVIDTLVNIKNLVLKNWLLILICAAIGGLGGWAYDEANFKPPQYSAVIVFNQETGADMSGGLSDLASSFGLAGLGGSTNSNIFAGENFFALFKSKTLMNRALFQTVTTPSGQKQRLANYYIERGGILRDEWKDSEEMQEFRFTSTHPDSMTVKESEAMGTVRTRITSNLALGQPNRRSSFIEFKCSTDNDTLSKVLAETWLQTVSDFYKENKVQKTMEILRISERKRDSLERALNRTEYQLARRLDQNQQIVVQEGKIAENRLSRNSGLLAGMYTGAIANVEAIRNSLIRETPLVTIIEKPTFPLEVITYPYGRAIKAGIVIGLVIALLIVFLGNVYRSVMNKPAGTDAVKSNV